MPYITDDRRKVLHRDYVIEELVYLMNVLDGNSQDESVKKPGLVAGDLNYLAYTLGLAFIKIKGKSYNNISDAIKALNGAAHELERRVLDPYEDEAILKNGDIEV